MLAGKCECAYIRVMSTIRKIRVDLFQMKQPDFAAAIGVSQGTVSRWERGMDPSLSQLSNIRDAALARGLDWNDSLFFSENPPEAAPSEAAE